MKTNAERILSVLDFRLTNQVELTLYGRAALSLGFDPPPEGCGHSMDVDAILALGQAERLLQTTNFWQAIDETNEALAEEELYVSHLFVENQVILTSSWKEERVSIAGPNALEKLAARAVVPESKEIHEQFQSALSSLSNSLDSRIGYR